MSAFFAFTKKEILEYIRTYKLVVSGVLFTIIGLYSPLFTLMTPKMLETINADKSYGITINPLDMKITALHSWTQFYTHTPFTCYLVIIILFSGLISNEVSRGTLVNILTKGLSRITVIMSKFIFMFSIWTIFFAISFLVSLVYTNYFWENNVSTSNLLFGIFCVWLFGMFLISLLLLAGVLFKNNYGVLLSTAVGYLILSVINMIPKVSKYNPGTLSSSGLDLLNGTKEISNLTPAVIITVSASILMIVASVVLFNKKKL